MSSDLIAETKVRMSKTISVLNTEFASLRAGRANPQVLDRVMVDYYGTPTPINQLGNFSTPEPRLLVITVWDNRATLCAMDNRRPLLLSHHMESAVLHQLKGTVTEERKRHPCASETEFPLDEQYMQCIKTSQKVFETGRNQSHKDRIGIKTSVRLP